jgi:hypothetical protein
MRGLSEEAVGLVRRPFDAVLLGVAIQKQPEITKEKII